MSRDNQNSLYDFQIVKIGFYKEKLELYYIRLAPSILNRRNSFYNLAIISRS